MRIAFTITMFFAALGSLPAELSAAGPALFIRFNEPMAAPRGFAEMCRAAPATCRVPGGMADADDDLRLLDHVNRRVNAWVRPRSDAAAFGRADLWRRAGPGANAAGDCEDIAIEKRAQLIDRGYPADRLFLAVVHGGGGVGLHVVLVARTPGGDLVLDSRSRRVGLWSHTPYAWVSAQSATEPTAWFRI